MSKARSRQDCLGLLARADPVHLARLWADAKADHPAFTWLRPPETGTAMVRGRTGATGAAFNVGEVSITRCSVQLTDGTVGHGYVQGRDRTHAETAALCDALLQQDDSGAGYRAANAVIAALAEAKAARDAARAAKAAATRVEFFTMVRGENT